MDDNQGVSRKRKKISIPVEPKTYAASGLKNTLHGNVYQLKLLMLFVILGREKYSFRLATEMDAAEKFDDLVFEYENERNDGTVYRFLQAKHKLDESKKITINDLLTETDGEFSLQKYFISYRKIKQNSEFVGKNKELKDFIICTNIDHHDSLQNDFEKVGNKDIILDIQYNSKMSKRLKLKINKVSYETELVSILKSTSDFIRLAKKLAECVIEEKSINLADPLFRSYHSSLKENRIIDIENKKLHSDFIENNNLPQLVKEFRKSFQESASIIMNLPQRNVNICNEVKDKQLKLSNSFGKVFQLETNPQITDIENFAEKISKLISQQNIVSIKRETTRTGIIKDNINKLAGHVLISEGEGKYKKIKFSSAFLDAADTSLAGNLQDFKTKLKEKLNNQKINFDQLGQFEFRISEFKTCEEGQKYLQKPLPNDTVTDDEIREFFEKLVFAVNQPNEVELEKIIEDKIGKEFNKNDTRNVYSRFQKGMLDWMKEKEGRFISHKDVEAFFEKLKEEILGSIWFNVKFPVKLFTGRIKELEMLHEAIQRNPEGTVISQITSISGLGGIGKSELARKYAFDYEQNYDNIIWINSETNETLEQSFFELARHNKLGIPTIDKDGKDKPVMSIVKEIYGFFAKKKCLFIFDNAEKNNDLKKFLPLCPLSPSSNIPKILITSRYGKWETGIKVIKLETLKLEDAIMFVKKGLKILDESQDEQIKDLVSKLQCFPLAIQQAIAYIEDQKEISEFEIKDYIKKYKEKTKVLLRSKIFQGIDNDYAKTTYTTWQITIATIGDDKEYGQSALKILNVIAYLAPENITRQMFLYLTDADEDQLIEAVRLLERYSMVNGEQMQSVLSIHRLVQEVIRLELNRENKEEGILREALELINNGDNFDKEAKENTSHVVSIWNYVSKYGQLINDFYFDSIYGKNKTPLHLLATEGNKDVVDTLIKGVWNINGVVHDQLYKFIKSEDNEQSTPLHFAAFGGYKDVVDSLIKSVWNINDITHDELYNFIKAEDNEQSTPLHLAATEGHKDVVDYLIDGVKNIRDITHEELYNFIKAEDNKQNIPLHLATFGGHKNVVDNLINGVMNIKDITHEELYKFIKAEDNKQSTPLHLAAMEGNEEIVYYLIQSINNIKGITRDELYEFIYAKDKNQSTPLHLAAMEGNEEIVDYLIQSINNIKGITRDELYEFIYAKDKNQSTSLRLAAMEGYKEIVDSLIKAVRNIKDITHEEIYKFIKADNDKQSTSLHLASLKGYKNVVYSLIQSVKNIKNITHEELYKFIKAEDNEQTTPLHLAATEGHKEIVDFLIEGVNNIAGITRDELYNFIMAKECNQLTPLHLAAMEGHKQIVDSLIEGVKNIQDITHDELYKFIKAEDNQQRTPLHLAATEGREDVVVSLIKAVWNIQDITHDQLYMFIKAEHNTQYTPLHLAALDGHKQIVDSLINGVKNITGITRDELYKFFMAKECYQFTPLHLAAMEGHKDVVDSLIKDVKDIQDITHDELYNFINTDNDSQVTPLHLATCGGHKEIVDSLIRAVWNIQDITHEELYKFINAADNKKYTPLHFAAMKGYKEIVDSLINAFRNIQDITHEELYKFINAEDYDQRTPHCLAVIKGHKEIVGFLKRL